MPRFGLFSLYKNHSQFTGRDPGTQQHTGAADGEKLQQRRKCIFEFAGKRSTTMTFRKLCNTPSPIYIFTLYTHSTTRLLLLHPLFFLTPPTFILLQHHLYTKNTTQKNETAGMDPGHIDNRKQQQHTAADGIYQTLVRNSSNTQHQSQAAAVTAATHSNRVLKL